MRKDFVTVEVLPDQKQILKYEGSLIDEQEFDFLFLDHDAIKGRKIMAKMTTQFCIECRKETEYKIQKEHLLHEIKGKSYDFEILVARCKECHEKVNLPGLMDINSKLIDEQYRQFENLVSIEDY